MINRILWPVDYFLPSHLGEMVDAQLFYRTRVIVASNLLSSLCCLLLLIAADLLNLSHIIIYGILVCLFTLIVQLVFLKFQKNSNSFEKKLSMSATVQVLAVSFIIYLVAFSEKGMGFFGLIWLIPIFLMMSFYFSSKYSFFTALVSIFVFLGIGYLKFDYFFKPIAAVANFSAVFYVFLTFVIILSYIISFLFVYLSKELQKEVVKQRDLLIESAKFQSLGRMATNLAHDINNPLFTIQGKLHQMRNLLSRDQLDLEKCDQIVDSVEQTILKLSKMVKGISTFAREGKGDHMISITVAELIESNLALSIDRIKDAGIDLNIEIDPEAEIICYPSFISQVLLNLLNNAIDALEGAPVKNIKVLSYKEKNWVYIRICDSGAGVSRDIEKKIFEPFFTTKTIGKGTGLGLSISKGLIEVHEGELSYERNEECTTFLIKFPSYE